MSTSKKKSESNRQNAQLSIGPKDTTRSRSNALTDKQLHTLPHLVTAPSLSEAARRADVGRTTLYRWIEDDEFRRELERQRNEALDLAHVELKGLMLKATQVIGETMDDANPLVRLRAAQIALSFGLKAIEEKEIQRRIQLLEDALPLWTTNTFTQRFGFANILRPQLFLDRKITLLGELSGEQSIDSRIDSDGTINTLQMTLYLRWG